MFVTLATAPGFGASSISYSKGGRVDSINLDLSVAEVSHRVDGALVVCGSGVIEKKPVRLKLVVRDQWTECKGPRTGEKPELKAALEISADGAESVHLDELVWRSFSSETRRSLFCTTYVGFTSSRRDTLENRRVTFWASDCGLCGDHEMQIALDVPRKSLQLVIFGVSYGRTYPDRVNEVFKDRANQSLEPTATAVTPRAGARVAPAAAVAHH
ncbi:hypothetical protein DB347_22710 [Opitutaceae bacterium EW11]|nr:hypothetical protein DB347_22710 [Opitutaceae bacterium EW11]